MKDIFLYFLWDKTGKSYFVKPDGSIALSAQPVWLKHKPIGWQDLELSFDTVDKYFSNVKSLSVPLQYVLDGAQILRYLLYKGKGFEEEVYCVILKLNTETDIHELEYKGRIDMSTAVDDPEIGVTVNGKEGGFQADLDANEDVTYELPLTYDNPDALSVLFDGIDLQDTYNYTIISAQTTNAETYFTVPLIFVNNEGDSVGIANGEQTYEEIPDDGALAVYEANSSNTFFETFVNVKKALFEGSISITQFGIPQWNIKFRSSKGFIYVVVPNTVLSDGETHVYNFSFVHDFDPTEKFFLIGAKDSPPLHTNILQFNETKFTIKFTTRNTDSQAYALTPLAIANQLVKKWNPKYSVVSNFLSVHNNIVATSGQSLRNLENPVLKYSFTDFWDDYNKRYCLCLNIIGDIMYIEKRDIRFASNSSNVVLDLGQLTSFTLSPLAANIINSIKIGWVDQKYDERNGKFEFNSTNEEKAPVSSKKGELNLVGKARGDGYGYEFMRGKLNNKDTTDNQGDNEVCLTNIVPDFTRTDSFTVQWTASTKQLRLGAPTDLISLFSVFTIGKPFHFATADIPGFNSFIFTPQFVALDGADLLITVNESYPSTFSLFTGFAIFPCKLKRTRYDSMTGVPVPMLDGIPRTDIPGAVYNYDEMSPIQGLMNWGPWLRSVLFQLPNGQIIYQTSPKNADVVTVLNGVTISEKAPIRVSKLGAAFFLNYRGKFTTKVPLTFYQTMSTLNSAGIVKGIVNGFSLEFIPVGKMNSKPATNEAQEWELTLSANNDLNTLYQLSQEGLYINDGMNNTLLIPVLNTVHYVYYNKQLNAKYKYKDLFDDWVHHRNDQFAVQPAYLQKWEFADTINQQFRSVGLAQVELFLYDQFANEVQVIQSYVVSNPAVRSPVSLIQLDINPIDYAEGIYVYALKSDGEILAISEWQYFANKHPGTYAIDFFNSYNKLNTYFAQYRPMIRVEAMFGVETFDGSSSDYKDETHSETLSFETDSILPIRFGSSYGMPTWMQAKLNVILRLDNTKVESIPTYLPNDSKWEITKPSGYPLVFAEIDLRRANKSMEIAVTSTGAQTEPAVIYTLDAEAFGQAPGVIDIEIEPG